MASHYLIILIFALTGAVTLWASVRDSDWFFTSRNTAYFVTRFGRRITRLVYFLIALLLLSFSLLIYLTPPRA